MTQHPTIIEMTIDGDFADPPPNAKPPFGARVMVWAAAIAAVAVAGAVMVFALWLLAFLIPVVLLAALVAYVAFRVQVWRGAASGNTYTLRWPPRR